MPCNGTAVVADKRTHRHSPVWTLGDAHALDPGAPTASIVLAAWRYQEHQGLPRASMQEQDDDQREAEPPDERVRDVWARAGVLVNELARPALCLNLPLAQVHHAIGSPGEPTFLSLRQLLRSPPTWAVAGKTVHICENPNLVAIVADRLGAISAPLVCTDGMPAAAQRTLLSQLYAAGAHLRDHGDFDWPGLQIANYVMREWSAQSWRFCACDYEAACVNTSGVHHALSDGIVQALWDMDLTSAMRHRTVAIAEEAVADSLLEDLRTMD